MKKKLINETHLEGFIYDHKLAIKESGPQSKNPGTEFISGTLNIATDDAMMNVIPVHFTYTTATFGTSGKTNTTFGILKDIIDGKVKTVVSDGKENAACVRVDSNLALNEWYDKEDKLVSVMRNEGGFVHIVPANEIDSNENKRNTFKVDIVINGCIRQEADDEKGTPEKMTIKGAIFNFKNELLPVKLSVVNPAAMNYFESLDASQNTPVFTKLWGNQISETKTTIKTEESAFGDDAVTETKSSYKDFVITGAAKSTYEWDTEETILASELSEAMAQREVTLAEIKKRQDEYQASKNNAIPAAAAPTAAPTKANYNF